MIGVKGECFLVKDGGIDAPVNDNVFGNAEFIAGNVATTELTAILAAVIKYEENWFFLNTKVNFFRKL